jgi:hypothetical protein|tara:strand:+ start:876 stop:1241 length:366 start_codon:yes stop_codon:yes gene_type:complete
MANSLPGIALGSASFLAGEITAPLTTNRIPIYSSSLFRYDDYFDVFYVSATKLTKANTAWTHTDNSKVFDWRTFGIQSDETGKMIIFEFEKHWWHSSDVAHYWCEPANKSITYKVKVDTLS